MLGMLVWSSLLVWPAGVMCQPHAVATFSILGDLVQNVGGDALRLHTLVGPGGDAHVFEPSPADSVTLRKASLLFEIGLGFEPWLEKLYAVSGSTARRVVVTTGLPLLRADREEHQSDSQHAHDQAQAHGEFDPHVWFDVQNVIAIVATIRDVLARVDPAQAQAYHTRAAQYTAALHELDAWIMAQVHTLPTMRRKLVTSHNNLGYFARRYGFTVAGAAIASVGTDEADPSAGEMAALVETVKALGVPAVFAETIVNPRLMQRLAAEAGVTLAPPLYTDALGAPGSAGSTYLAMMRYNVTTIVRALQP
jgi:ABC-type Zn uptake system ZnuABC Zn-binding protein ZnuA